MKKWLIVICGPTATGKTALSIQLAKHFSSEIISADSRQFYKELKIGSAPPSEEELKTIPHYFIANKELTEDFSAGKFEQEALQLLEKLYKEKDILFLVGGSGLYIRAICEGLDDFPEVDPQIRERLIDELEEKGISHLRNQLKELDPEYYETVDQSNPQRLIRALEVCLGTGQKYSKLRGGEKKQRPFEVLKIGVEMDREELYQRINMRVGKMIEAGLVEEARSVYHLREKNALQTVGYKELFEHFDGNISLEEAIELIKRNTRRFAKRQFTWFRRDEEINWFKPEEVKGIIALIESRLNE